MRMWIGSPNYDKNRKPIDRIVIHWIVGTLRSADAQFQKKSPGTSAHYAIEDNAVHQYVKEESVAYHAGKYSMNQRSVGIEHSADPDRKASEKTYQSSGKLVAEVCKRYNIPIDRKHILKHSEVKATQCPGTIDLNKIIKIARGANMSDDIMISKKVFEELVTKATTRDLYAKIFTSPAQATQLVSDLREDLKKKSESISEQRERADRESAKYKALLALVAKSFDVSQKIDLVAAKLEKAEKILTEAEDATTKLKDCGVESGDKDEKIDQLTALLKENIKLESVQHLPADVIIQLQAEIIKTAWRRLKNIRRK